MTPKAFIPAVLLTLGIGCNTPNSTTAPPPPLAAIKTYDKVTGFSMIRANRVVPIASLDGWVTPVVVTKEGVTTYGLRVFAKAPNAMIFGHRPAALFYAKGPGGENRDEVEAVFQPQVELVDFVQETAAYRATQVANAAGALGSMLAGTANYYQPTPFYGDRYERVHYWKHSFIIPLRREAFRQVLAADDVTLRLNNANGAVDFSLPMEAKAIFQVVEDELAKEEHPVQAAAGEQATTPGHEAGSPTPAASPAAPSAPAASSVPALTPAASPALPSASAASAAPAPTPAASPAPPSATAASPVLPAASAATWRPRGR